MFPPVKGSLSGLNSPGIFSKRSMHISDDPFNKKTIDVTPKKSKAQMM
jgi:hypothetical protein